MGKKPQLFIVAALQKEIGNLGVKHERENFLCPTTFKLLEQPESRQQSPQYHKPKNTRVKKGNVRTFI